MSGVVPDARTLIDHARVETQTHWFNYAEPILVKRCASIIGKKCAGFGEGDMARPYGVAMLVAGVDENGPQLYCIDPSGTCTKYLARAIGAGSEGAQSTLKEQYNKSMSLEEAKTLALDILKQVMEETITEHNVEVAVIPVNNANQ
jgi:20S proteasome subunit alpha 5